MLMEFSLDVNNCRTNWMRKQAGLWKYADGEAAKADAPKPTFSKEDEERASNVLMGAPDATELTEEQKAYQQQLAAAYKAKFEAADSAGMINTMTGSLGGLSAGALIALARPKEKRDWKTWLASLGIGGGLGYVGGSLSEGYNRHTAGSDASKALHNKNIEVWLKDHPAAAAGTATEAEATAAGTATEAEAAPADGEVR